MALSGLITLKYITAFTFIETLSFVITSCGGTSKATVLRLTVIILSIKGIRIMRPGPFTPISLPSLNITPLSYSLRILMATNKNRTAIAIIITNGLNRLIMFAPFQKKAGLYGLNSLNGSNGFLPVPFHL